MKDSVQAIKPEAEEKFFTIPVSSFMQSDTSNIMNNNKRTSCHTKNLRNNHKVFSTLSMTRKKCKCRHQ